MKKSKKRRKAKAAAPQAIERVAMRVRPWIEASRRIAPKSATLQSAPWAAPLRSSADYVDRDGF